MDNVCIVDLDGWTFMFEESDTWPDEVFGNESDEVEENGAYVPC